MNEHFRGGNGRLLARLLDQYELPLAILDRSGQIVFVNASLCQLAKMEATSLVGHRCSWKVAADGPVAALLSALAPPSSALEGRAMVRQLTVPIVFGSTETGQLFVPLGDNKGVVEFTLMVLGDFARIHQILPTERRSSMSAAAPDSVLLQIRSRWKTLDNLLAMIGSSPAMELAFLRAEMAIRNPCNLLIHGPAGVGKLEVAQGIYLGRLKAASCQLSLGQFFPLDCRVLDLELIDSMLEIFSDRLQADLPRVAQQLILTGIDKLSNSGLERLLDWTNLHQDRCWMMATSSLSTSQLASRGSHWSKMIHRLAAIEIELPCLAERREDIPALALQALSEECHQADRAQLLLSADASDRLVAYAWPGNVRQLRTTMKQAVQQAVLTCSVQTSHLPLAIRTYAGTTAKESAESVIAIQLDAVLLDVEKKLLSRALKLSPRNRARAARLLGISRPRLLRRIEQLGLGNIQPDIDAQDDGG